MNTPKPSPVRDALAALKAKYQVFRDHQPLAIGVNKQLAGLHPEIDAKLLKMAIHRHATSIPYLKAMEKATHRLDLEGNPASEIDDGHRQHAAEQLKEKLKQRAEAFRAQEQAKKAQEQAQKAQEQAQKAEQRRAEKLEQLAAKFGKKSA